MCFVALFKAKSASAHRLRATRVYDTRWPRHVMLRAPPSYFLRVIFRLPPPVRALHYARRVLSPYTDIVTSSRFTLQI